MNVIERIEELRGARGLSVNKLAELSGMSQSTLSSILKSDNRTSLNVDTLERICEGLSITPSAFFMTEEQKETVTAQEKIILYEFRKLPVEKKKALIALLAD